MPNCPRPPGCDRAQALVELRADLRGLGTGSSLSEHSTDGERASTHSRDRAETRQSTLRSTLDVVPSAEDPEGGLEPGCIRQIARIRATSEVPRLRLDESSNGLKALEFHRCLSTNEVDHVITRRNPVVGHRLNVPTNSVAGSFRRLQPHCRAGEHGNQAVLAGALRASPSIGRGHSLTLTIG